MMLDPRLNRLIQTGLRHYAEGDVSHAASCWRQVLGVEPEHPQAQAYLRLLAGGVRLPAPQGDFEEPDATEVTISIEAGVSDGLDLLESSNVPSTIMVPTIEPQISKGPPRSEPDTLMEGARELFGLGDFSGSLRLVQQALTLDPFHAEASNYLERNRETLIQMYESKIGSLKTRPRVILRPDEIVWLNLDHRAGFVMAQLDGTISVEDVYALTGLSRLDTARILAELVEQGVIAT